jgi:hypothetical protein
MKIPDDQQEAVLRLLLLNDRTATLIRRGLESARDGSSTKEIADTLSASVTEITEKDLFEIVSIVRTLYLVRSNSDTPLAEFAEDLTNSIQEIKKGSISPEKIDALRRNIMELLDVNPFGLSSKARDLQTEDERTFCRARIITDLRPVFGDDIESGPQALVVVHLLKIGFHQAGMPHTDFFVSLDSQDLDTLKEVIERAQEKSESLKNFINDLPYLGI